jgi:RNA polymerase sigma-70 factor (ECF subfamily)
MTPAVQHTTFDAWLQEHAGILHRVANGFATGPDRDDLMQEMLLALWRAVPAFAGQSKVSTFVYRVAHNAALTWYRGKATYRRRVEAFEAEPRRDPDQDIASRTDEALRLLYAQIRGLPPVDRSLILLQLDGVSYAAIAEIHGLTENHVGVRLSRIRQKLADALQEKTDELR